MMNELPFYIITSDSTSHILLATTYLYNKYWGDDQQFKILGNNPPSFDLPHNFEFIKIKDDNKIQNWSRHIYNFLEENEKSNHIIITLDDYFPIRKLNEDIYKDLVNLSKSNNKIGRINIGYFNPNRTNEVKFVSKNKGYKLFYLKQTAPYRLTCQTSIWETEYLLSFLKNNFTPWQLELDGSQMSNNDGREIAITYSNYAFDWIQESVLSGRYPEKVNVLGLPTEDLKYFIDNGILNENLIQFGLWQCCPIIEFKDVGLHFNLNNIQSKIYNCGDMLEDLNLHYGYIYK